MNDLSHTCKICQTERWRCVYLHKHILFVYKHACHYGLVCCPWACSAEGERTSPLLNLRYRGGNSG